MEEEYKIIGSIDIEVLIEYFNITTNKLIITKERIEHINKRHNNDYDLYNMYINKLINDPDYILKDVNNINTVLYLKNFKELNLQIVIKLQTTIDINKYITVITFWHMRKRSYKQIINKNQIIFKKVDKKE